MMAAGAAATNFLFGGETSDVGGSSMLVPPEIN
jgi:hypothetical protein